MTNSTRKKAIIYTRTARTVHARAETHAAQERLCRTHAEVKGYEVVKVFTDIESGSTVDRPALNAMLEFLTQHRAEPHAVIVADRSRLARGVVAFVHIKDAIAAAGGTLEFPIAESVSDQKLTGLVDAADRLKASLARELEGVNER